MTQRLLFAAALCLSLTLTTAAPQDSYAASAYSPRHSGLEPPGGPKPLRGLSGNSTSRTTEGGRGYTDAYGNTIDDVKPAEKAPRQRPRPGAYGGYNANETDRPLPNPDKSSPLWTFQ